MVRVAITSPMNSSAPLLDPQYVKDGKDRPKAVLLPMSEWEQIVQELEELDYIRAYAAAKEQSSETIPFEQAIREIRLLGETRLLEEAGFLKNAIIRAAVFIMSPTETYLPTLDI